MSEGIVVIGVGMTTSVGLTAPETAASVRTGTMRFVETTMRDHRFEAFTMAEVPEEGLAELNEGVAVTKGLTSREVRMLRLAANPLVECLGAVKLKGAKPGLILALPEASTMLPLEPPAILRLLGRQTDGAFDLELSEASEVGRAGGLLAIRRAADVLKSGQPAAMIAGGIDTYRDLYVLATLDTQKRVKSSSHSDGFIPGEGACFLLLMTESNAKRADIAPLARLSAVLDGFEEGHFQSETPYRGDGLAATIRRLVESGQVGEPIREVYSSMNGENYWAKEWGVSFIRNRPSFDEDLGMHHPADCFGDTGAACGPLMVGLAALGMAGGYRQGPALVYGSSDSGERAALAVSAA